VLINTAEHMQEFGAKLAMAALPSAIIYLQGNLGAGKTTLAQGFIHSLGYEGRVKSPTYTLVESYNIAELKVFHFDLYRINHPDELEFIGIHEYFEEAAICLVEWPEHGKTILPLPDLICYIESRLDGREIKLSAESARGIAILNSLKD
jgi:tRNA threonylcarbamoyladenosine biosynthesis protein TsaE